MLQFKVETNHPSGSSRVPECCVLCYALQVFKEQRPIISGRRNIVSAQSCGMTRCADDEHDIR